VGAAIQVGFFGRGVDATPWDRPGSESAVGRLQEVQE